MFRNQGEGPVPSQEVGNDRTRHWKWLLGLLESVSLIDNA